MNSMDTGEKRYVSLLETAMCGTQDDVSSSSESTCSNGHGKKRLRWRRKKTANGCTETAVVRRHPVVFKELTVTPLGFSGKLYPLNHAEQKERFLRHGLVPDFTLRAVHSRRKQLSISRRAAIRFEHLDDACRILTAVRDRFGDGSAYLYEAFGPRISRDQASDILAEYISEHNLDRKMTVYWAPELTCSAKMIWRGPHRKVLRPENRRFTLVIKNSSENQYLREKAVRCLADHEIGTHFFRMYNEGFQPWYRDRGRFNLRGTTTRQYVCAEEGLAAVNTMLNANFKYLWTPAILYYTACKATELTFHELYDDLGQFITDAEQRWKHVMRVKRYLTDVNGLGGYGGDQCYLEGALKLLRNVETIDWVALYSGAVCLDEVQRVRRVARRDIISLPTFLADLDQYRQQLRHIAEVNGLTSAAACADDSQLDRRVPLAVVNVAFQKSLGSRQRTAAKPPASTLSRCALKHPANNTVPSPTSGVPAKASMNMVKGEKIGCIKDESQLTLSVAPVASQQRMNTAKRLAHLHIQRDSVHGISLAFKRLR